MGMNKYRWCLFKNGHEHHDPTYVWWCADEVYYNNLPSDFYYHRADGPFAKGSNDSKPVGWWYKGKALGLYAWLEANNEISEEEKALLILRFA
jgi:hypothetical protein